MSIFRRDQHNLTVELVSQQRLRTTSEWLHCVLPQFSGGGRETRECSGNTAGPQHTPMCARSGGWADWEPHTRVLSGGHWSVGGHGWSPSPHGSSALWDPPSRASASHDHAWAAFLTPCISPPPTSPPPTAGWVSPQGDRDTPGHAAPCHHLVKGTGPQTKQSLYEPHRESASAAENALINGRFQHEGLGAGECVLSPGSGKGDPGGMWPCTPSPWWRIQ